MANLGSKKRSETFRIIFTFETAPTGTPTFIINLGGTSVLTTTALDPLDAPTNKTWYYDYTTAADAAVGLHQIIATAVIDGESIPASHFYDQTINNIDDVHNDTQTIISNLNVSAGARAIVINVKDGDTNPVEGVRLSVHNSNNDDSPLFGQLLTDALGNTATINLDDATYKVRLSKPGGIVSEVKTMVVSASGTENMTVTLLSITPPANPEVSTVYISVYDLDGSVVSSGVELTITKHDDITKDASGNFATSTGIVMTYDAPTSTWQADIIKNTHCKITSTKVLGVDDTGTLIDREFSVGSGSTTNLGSIRLS